MTHQIVLDCETARRRMAEGAGFAGDLALAEHLEMCPDCAPARIAWMEPLRGGDEAGAFPRGDAVFPHSYLTNEFRATLHGGIMRHIRANGKAATPCRALIPYYHDYHGWRASAPRSAGLAACVVLGIFALAFSIFLWHNGPVEKAAVGYTGIEAREAGYSAPLSVSSAPSSRTEVVAGPVVQAAVADKGSVSSPAPRSAVRASHEREAVVPVRVRIEGFETVLEWNALPGERYRVLRSETPDFTASRYVEWREVEGASYRDSDPKTPSSGVCYYRVERLVG